MMKDTGSSTMNQRPSWASTIAEVDIDPEYRKTEAKAAPIAIS